MRLNKFLDQFPDNATEWSQATDEIRDLAYNARVTLEEVDGKIIEPLNFANLTTPAQWNTNAKIYIRVAIDTMSLKARDEFLGVINDLFNITSFALKDGRVQRIK